MNIKTPYVQRKDDSNDKKRIKIVPLHSNVDPKMWFHTPTVYVEDVNSKAINRRHRAQMQNANYAQLARYIPSQSEPIF